MTGAGRGRTAACAFVLTLLVLVFAGGGSADAQQTRWTLGYFGPADGPGARISDRLVSELRAADPAIKIESNPARLEVNDIEIARAVRDGIFDFGVLPGHLLAREVEQVGLLDLPMLATNVREARAIVTDDTVAAILHDHAERRGLRILGYTWVIGTFVSTRGCVVTPDQIRGAKVIDGPRLHQELMRKAGAAVVPVFLYEAMEGLVTGVGDAALFSVPFIVEANLVRATRCLTAVERAAIMVVPVVLITRAEMWNGLSLQQETAVEKAVAAVEDWAEAEASKLAETASGIYRERGNEVAEFSADAVAQWRELAEELHARFAEKVNDGGTLVDHARRAAAQARPPS